MRLFRVTIEVADLEAATSFYARLLGRAGQRHPGSRHYFDCGGVTLAVLDVTHTGMQPTPGPKSLYIAVDNLESVHARAAMLKALAKFQVHGEPAADVIQRPWGERSFYVTDPWGNELCFVDEKTLYR
jgi:catechol 2,3-dioxygenase-like lactoylglutathione lyase family enzyme